MGDMIRLDKCLTLNYGLSRKEAGTVIRKGRVSVNGSVVKDAAAKVSAEDLIVCDGDGLEVVTEERKRYFLINKPKGCVCSNDDPQNPIVLTLLEGEAGGLFCVGRLDLDTEGLLFITDDGGWAHRITSPKKSHSKTYEVWLAEDCPEENIRLFAEGVMLRGEKYATRPAVLEIMEPRHVLLTITEGRYHQVKRMFASTGNKVVGLKRIAIGDIRLDEDLQSGEYRELTAEEIAMF